MNLTDISMLCRLCMRDGCTLFPLFRNKDSECKAIELSMQVAMCTAISVSKFDSLPKKICIACRNFVREWYIFRRKCQRMDAILRNSACRIPSEVPDSNLSCLKNEEDGLSNQQAPSDPEEKDNVSENDFEELENIKMEDDIPKRLPAENIKVFSCNVCSQNFLYLHELSLHRLENHILERGVRVPEVVIKKPVSQPKKIRTKFQMECCGRLFVNRNYYRQHRQQRHPEEKPFACDICGKRNFISEDTLKRHKMLHTGRYACKLCGRTFTCQAILRLHVRDKHENDRPFVCDVCGKAFVTELLLGYHQRFHTGEKKYVCEECGVAVVTSSSLAKHKRIHSKVKPHVCEVCGKGFIVRGRLLEHIRLHTGERPFVCEVCKKAFRMRDKFKRHIRTHIEPKPYSCEICGRGYSTNHGLSIHLKSHSSRHQ